jgi:hypothetical protein
MYPSRFPISVNAARTSRSISLTSCAGDNRCDSRDGTASIPALTVRKTLDHSASTAAAGTNSRRAFASCRPDGKTGPTDSIFVWYRTLLGVDVDERTRHL